MKTGTRREQHEPPLGRKRLRDGREIRDGERREEI
jgi:hypothetical protein